MNGHPSVNTRKTPAATFPGQLPSPDRVFGDFGTIVVHHPCVLINPDRVTLIRQVIRRREALPAKQGFLYIVTPAESTGRSPLDTYMVRDQITEATVDWTSPNNHPLDGRVFERLWQDGLDLLLKQDRLFLTERSIGADPTYALPVRTITNSALTALFTLNMFRPAIQETCTSLLAERPFHLLVLPGHHVESGKYKGHLRCLENGDPAHMVIAMDFENRRGLVIGSAYGGTVKKLMFTVMNYYLPFIDVLPFHCSASENSRGETALFLGLSGTGKTSLSTDPGRLLLGDDEHGWSEQGIANFEYGCYAKLINLDPEKEPEIYQAVFHEDHCLRHGVIVENTMVYPDGSFDLCDKRLTPNSRASYPLSFLSSVKPSACGAHPRTIVFLTADANGVIPPISRLSGDQAMLWFLMGYTSKLAGTETGIVDPVTVFSRFFGEPFMPLLPEYYASMLGEKLQRHPVSVFLLNTGWSGGPHGIGKRMDIRLTRHLLNRALDGELDHVAVRIDKRFHLQVPKECPGVPSEILNPRSTWRDRSKFDERADHLAAEFFCHFEKAYGHGSISRTIGAQCPGR